MTTTANKKRDAQADRDNARGALKQLVHKAGRCIPKVGSQDYPTEWDRLHRAMDALLDHARDKR